MRVTRMGTALAAVLTTTCAMASPLDWPGQDDNEAMALHCAAVLSAYANAYGIAVDLMGQDGGARLPDLPDGLVQMAGGAGRLPDIADIAAGFESHADAVARTSFYPTLTGDGTPYLTDDGRALITAVQSCAERFEL